VRRDAFEEAGVVLGEVTYQGWGSGPVDSIGGWLLRSWAGVPHPNL
jgi:hypothetical protein